MVHGGPDGARMAWRAAGWHPAVVPRSDRGHIARCRRSMRLPQVSSRVGLGWRSGDSARLRLRPARCSRPVGACRTCSRSPGAGRTSSGSPGRRRIRAHPAEASPPCGRRVCACGVSVACADCRRTGKERRGKARKNSLSFPKHLPINGTFGGFPGSPAELRGVGPFCNHVGSALKKPYKTRKNR